MLTTTRGSESSVQPVTLFVAFELGSTRWKLAFAVGLGHRPRVVQLPARDLGRVWKEIARAKTRFQRPADSPVRSCYEAGRDGFWLHRALSVHAVTKVVVDPARPRDPYATPSSRRRPPAVSAALPMGEGPLRPPA